MPKFRFMTGAQHYRCEARDRAEALRVAWQSLQPDENTWAVISATLYEEEAALAYVAEPGHEYEE
jgi:hypothetical protein